MRLRGFVPFWLEVDCRRRYPSKGQYTPGVFLCHSFGKVLFSSGLKFVRILFLRFKLDCFQHICDSMTLGHVLLCLTWGTTLHKKNSSYCPTDIWKSLQNDHDIIWDCVWGETPSLWPWVLCHCWRSRSLSSSAGHYRREMHLQLLLSFQTHRDQWANLHLAARQECVDVGVWNVSMCWGMSSRKARKQVL